MVYDIYTDAWLYIHKKEPTTMSVTVFKQVYDKLSKAESLRLNNRPVQTYTHLVEAFSMIPDHISLTRQELTAFERLRTDLSVISNKLQNDLNARKQAIFQNPLQMVLMYGVLELFKSPEVYVNEHGLYSKIQEFYALVERIDTRTKMTDTLFSHLNSINKLLGNAYGALQVRDWENTQGQIKESYTILEYLLADEEMYQHFPQALYQIFDNFQDTLQSVLNRVEQYRASSEKLSNEERETIAQKFSSSLYSLWQTGQDVQNNIESFVHSS